MPITKGAEKANRSSLKKHVFNVRRKTAMNDTVKKVRKMVEAGKYEEAATYYEKAANYKPNKFFTPTYLMKAGLAHEKANHKDLAIKAYQRVVDEFWDSSDFQNARKYKARLETNS